jgi:hypothetical protein
MLLQFSSGVGLAIKAAVIVCALASQSCLMPQSVDPIVEVPHPAPRFVLALLPAYLLPPVLQLYRQGSADASHSPPCHCQLEFDSVWVEEDDPTVSLEARWFVDYDTSVRASLVFESRILPGDFNTPNTVRELTPPFAFDADKLGIVTDGMHVVEVVVAETAAWDKSSISLPSRAVLPGYASAVYRFFVNVKVTQDASRPLCPGQRPSVRLPAGVCG